MFYIVVDKYGCTAFAKKSVLSAIDIVLHLASVEKT